MLSHWFLRDGISQFLAPDKNAPEQPDEAQSDFLLFLAPDPNFAPAEAPPPGAFANRSTSVPDKVQCQNCHQWTPVTASDTVNTPVQRKAPSTPSNRDSSGRIATGTPFRTPSPSYKPSEYAKATGMAERVEALVLSGVKETAYAKFSPQPVQQKNDKCFRCCTSVRMDDKLAKRLQNLLEKNPWLLHARSRDLGQLAPDGFTPLMAASYSGAIRPATLLVEFAAATNDGNAGTSIFDEVDAEGRTALHLAAEYGHYDIVQLLLPKYLERGSNEGTSMASPMPLDLLGRTPLGSAITSPHKSARKKQKEVKAALFSPRDLSIFGVPRPEAERTHYDEELKLSYGIADMPGMRVEMEDAICTCRFECHGKTYWLFAVCDGHGDQGHGSDFVATNVPTVLQTHMTAGGEDLDWNAIWKATCLEVDQKLQQSEIVGGSTGVFALVGPEVIVVANVGDSRAILIHRRADSTGLEEAVETMAISESSTTEGYPAMIDADQPQKAIPDHVGEPSKEPSSGPIVTALSDDHKPNLPEEQTRIENAGMKVVPITFQEEDGQEITIHKVAKTDNDMLAVSRAFGDFEYKANTTLSPEDQAVTAVPEVRIHTRSSSDLFLVLACDGVWDVCDNGFVKDFVLNQVQARRDSSDTAMPEVADALLFESLNRGSQDNMTTILVALESQTLPSIMEGKALDFGSALK